MAVHVNSAFLPLATVILCGGTVIVGGSTAWKVQNIQLNTIARSAGPWIRYNVSILHYLKCMYKIVTVPYMDVK